MKINEVAKLTGITVRTLHYYDEIGLLKPSEITEGGYRLYDENSLATLQQILFFRELDFSLADIRAIMTAPRYDKSEALNKHRQLLLQKKQRLSKLIELVDNTLKGETDMSFKQFDSAEIEASRKKYADEARERWGDTAAYAESVQKTECYSANQWSALSAEGEAILHEFAESRHLSPDSDVAQALVTRWQDYITASYYHCTSEILSCLGLMYISDERFTKNLDQHGTGTAQFMASAIEIYCKS